MKYTVNVAIQVLPGSKDKEMYSLVDAAIHEIMQSGLKYRVCPFETVIEGTYDQVMAVVRKAQEACFNAGAEDLLVNLKIQLRKDAHVTMEEKTGKYD